MKITRLHVSGFKNIEPLTITFENGLSAFWGDNGMGKTNLLESLFVLAKGRSFRPYSHRQDWYPENGRNLGVEAIFQDSFDLEYHAQLHLKAPNKPVWLLNGKKVHRSVLSEKIPLVVFSPDDHNLIRGGPESRREYLDQVFEDVCPGYSEVLSRYGDALKSRNKLLKSYQRNEVFEFTHEMNTWTRSLAEEAHQLSSLRRELWPYFSEHFQSLSRSLFEGLVDKIDLFSEFALESGNKEEYFQILKDSYRVDLATGWTHKGPHRDDFRIELNGLDARAKASQGQARLLALSLRWCHALWVAQERGEIPLFLIDDFSNELDILRRKKLLDLMGQISGQTLITGTDKNLIKTSGASDFFTDFQSFKVRDGKIEQEI